MERKGPFDGEVWSNRDCQRVNRPWSDILRVSAD